MPEAAEDKRLPIGIVLAGGLGRRIGGGDKPLLSLGGRTMLDRVIERLAPQVARIAINANGDPARFAAYDLPVVADTIAGFAGPLAGILAGMDWGREVLPAAPAIISVAGDTPFFPEDFASALAGAHGRTADTIVLARSRQGTHPVFGLWPVSLADDLRQFLATGESGKILAFVDRHRRLDVTFPDLRLPDGSDIDPFFNVNTIEDVRTAEQIAAAFGKRAE